MILTRVGRQPLTPAAGRSLGLQNPTLGAAKSSNFGLQTFAKSGRQTQPEISVQKVDLTVTLTLAAPETWPILQATKAALFLPNISRNRPFFVDRTRELTQARRSTGMVQVKKGNQHSHANVLRRRCSGAGQSHTAQAKVVPRLQKSMQKASKGHTPSHACGQRGGTQTQTRRGRLQSRATNSHSSPTRALVVKSGAGISWHHAQLDRRRQKS